MGGGGRLGSWRGGELACVGGRVGPALEGVLVVVVGVSGCVRDTVCGAVTALGNAGRFERAMGPRDCVGCVCRLSLG